MLIRSQDKTELINLNNATSISAIPEYGNKKSIVVKLIGEDRWTILGYYSDEKAVKVLDMIHKHYNSCKLQQIFPNECEYVVDFIFIMPQEDEI